MDVGTRFRDAAIAEQLTCTICEKRFRRPEHLKRHVLGHSQEKSFKCSHCDLAFKRKDAAQRHERRHPTPSNATETSSLTTKFCRTCLTCTKSRIKCSGGQPCSHCGSRNLVCTYRPRKRKYMDDTSEHSINIFEDAAHDQGDNMGTSAQLLNNDFTEERDMTNSGESFLIPEPNHARLDPDPHMLPIRSSITGRSEEHALHDYPPDRETVAEWQDHWGDGRVPINWLPFDEESSWSPLFVDPAIHERQFGVGVDVSGVTTATQTQVHSQPAMRGSEGHSTIPMHDQMTTLITLLGSQPLSITESITSPSGSREDDEQGDVGRLYIDGTGARLSQSKRRVRRSDQSRSIRHLHDATAELGSQTSWVETVNLKARSTDSNRQEGPAISPEVHMEIVSRLLNDVHLIWPCENTVVAKQVIMDTNMWNYYIDLYFDNFHRIYPFIDRSLLSLPVWGWVLCVATAALGARYSGDLESTLYGELLSKTLHEKLLLELDVGQKNESLPYIQARALTAVGLSLSHSRSLVDLGTTALVLTCNSCLRLRLFEEDDRIGAVQSDQDFEQSWVAWRFRETRRRTGLFVFLIDSMLAYTRTSPPQLPQDCLKLRLPSSELFWNAKSCSEWLSIYEAQSILSTNMVPFRDEENLRTSVHQSAEELWTKLEAATHISEYGTTLLIHSIIRRVWSIKQYLEHPAYSWSSGRTLDLQRNVRRASPLNYIAASPDFSTWRNGVCDCLDVLHWEALGNTAKARGVESSVLLHLHIARLVILTPFKELLDALHTTKPSSECSLPHMSLNLATPDSKSRYILSTWATKDRHKARLALVHAGAVFWHVRRYSSESIIQPFAVYLATAVLWGYGTYTHKHLPTPSSTLYVQSHVNLQRDTNAEQQEPLFGSSTHQTGPNSHIGSSLLSTPHMSSTICANGKPESHMPAFVQIDRPVDDEIVQHFIRSGESMRLYLEGVPDLCSSGGPIQVLQQGASILSDMSCVWTIAEGYSQCLKIAAEVNHQLAETSRFNVH